MRISCDETFTVSAKAVKEPQDEYTGITFVSMSDTSRMYGLDDKPIAIKPKPIHLTQKACFFALREESITNN